MNLTRAVIHEIIKQPQTNDATSFLSAALLPINDGTIRLATALNNAFSKDDNSYGNFRIAENNFYENFQMHREILNDDSFLGFTRTTTENLCEILRTIFLAKGGFFVYCEYDLSGIRFTSVFLVRDVEGVLFNRDNEHHTFRINQVRYLDTNKLAMGARVNIEKMLDGDNNHIALTTSNQADISEYFIEWIGVTRPESNADFTNKLFQIISEMDRPINPETNQQYDLNEFREVAYNLIRASPNRVVNLRDLSNSLFQDENRIIQFAEQSNLLLDHEFRYDGRALSRFKRITATREGIRLSFSRGDILDGKVSLSQEEIDLITIRSRGLAEAIRQQLNPQ